MNWAVEKNIRLVYISKDVPREITYTVLGTIEYVIDKFRAHEKYLEVYIYRDMDEYVAISGMGHPSIYFVMHEAYMGWPRIHVIYSLTRELDGDVFRAGLIHEAIHSIIHGSPKYYVITPPHQFTEKCIEEYGEGVCSALYNLLASAVKDYEVSHTALKHDIIDEYTPFLNYYLDEVYIDISNYEGCGLEKIILLGNITKQLLAAYPYRSEKNISSKISLVSDSAREILGIDFNDVYRILERFTEDTYNNIIMFIEWFVDKVI